MGRVMAMRTRMLRTPHRVDRRRRPMPDERNDEASPTALGRATDWLNEKLEPVLGPPPITPNDHVELPPIEDRPCPICGQPMGAHRREVEAGNVYYHHPGNEESHVMESERTAEGKGQE